MSILENIGKSRDAAKATSAPSREEERTLADILHNQRDNKLFGDYLKLSKTPDVDLELAARLKQAKLNPDDLDKLEEKRSKFMEQMNEAKKIAESITPDMAEKMAEKSDVFKKILRQAGKERMSQMWQAQLYELAINHEIDFKNITNSFKTLETQREVSDKRIQKFCKENEIGIDSDAYERIMSIENQTERRRALQEQVHASYGIFRTFFDKVGGGIFSHLDAKSYDKSEQRNLKKELDAMNANIGALGAVLQGTINKNDMIREAFTREILSEKMPPKKDMDFNEGKTLRPDKEKIIAEWKRRRPVNFDALTPAVQESEKDRVLNELSNEYSKQVEEKEGFWATVLAALFGSFAKTFDKTLLK